LWLLIAAMCVLLWATVLATLRRPRIGDRAEVTVGVGAAVAPLPRAQLLADRALQSITLAFGLGLSAQVGFLMHQVAFLSGRIGLDAAGAGVALTTTVALLSRVATGLVIDRFDPRRTAAANFLVQIAALAVLLAAPSAAWTYLGCALFGISVGNMITLPNLIVQREFASAQFARTVSLMWAIVQLVLAFGPGVLGLVRDLSGSYDAALIVCIALELVACAAVLVRRPMDRAGVVAVSSGPEPDQDSGR
jgi:cyanate permease